jgi:hypothetical protein
MDHREGKGEPIDKQYGPRHTMHVEPGGMLDRMGLPAIFDVNSIHGQASMYWPQGYGWKRWHPMAWWKRFRSRTAGVCPGRAMAPEFRSWTTHIT